MHEDDAGALRPRVALYSHDTMGLGHMRRNVLLAKALTSSPLKPVVLLIAGAREAGNFAMPPGVDCLTLPALGKAGDGQYQARTLGIGLPDLVAMRANTIRSVLEAFEPDVLVVDKVPRGALGELDPTLASLRARGRTRCVLGLRDVLDDPATVAREWADSASDEAIREHFAAVWVYGDPAVYDPVREYGLSPDVAAKVRYTGYFDQRARLEGQEEEGPPMAPAASPVRFAQCLVCRRMDCRRCPLVDPLADLGLPPGRLVLCMVGGGQDGAHLAEAFAQADLPPDTNGLIITGPFMPPEVQQRLRRRAAAHPRLLVLDFVAEPTLLLNHADRVIAMGGYNTVWEVLSFEKRALIVPRVRPRAEQLIRAERLRDLGVLDVLHPDGLSPQALSAWLARDPGPAPRVRERIDLNGLARLPGLLEEVLLTRPHPARGRSPEGGRERVA